MIIFLYNQFFLKRWQSEPWAEGQKTQILKVLCFKPNFRGRLFMTIMGMIWNYFLKNHPKKLFIHDWTWFHDFPRTMSLVDSSSSNSYKVFPQS